MDNTNGFKFDYIGNILEQHELKCKMNLSVYPSDLIHHWSRTGLTANFAAAFFSFIHPNDKSITNTLSAILNELVENAVKFSLKEDFSITLNLYQYEDKIIFETINVISAEQHNAFKHRLTDLLDETVDIETKYFHQVLENVQNNRDSGLGLITLLHDYKVKLGVVFNKAGGENYSVHVQAIINPEEIRS